MKKHILLSFLLLAPSIALALPQVITLKDGSQIKGELTGVANGTYTLHTETMGDIQVSSAQVASINSEASIPVATIPAATPLGSGPNASSSTPSVEAQMNAVQSQLMTDPNMMADIQAMVNDPEIAQLLTDPALMQAVIAKDPKALEKNPKGQALMNNPKMQALAEKLQSRK